MPNYTPPGVYIQEQNAFPNSAVAVETAIPVFIGYTQKAERNGKSLLRVPTRIESFAEYVEVYGGSFNAKFRVVPTAGVQSCRQFKLGTTDYSIDYAENSQLYFYNSIRLFYANGGGVCYILSVGLYGDQSEKQVVAADYQATEEHQESPFDLLEREGDPTLIVLPDIAVLGAGAYPIYQDVLAHCGKMMNRFAIFDVRYHDDTEKTSDVIREFRAGIGESSLMYGAAYYPWVNTTVVDPEEITFERFDAAELSSLLEPITRQLFDSYADQLAKLTDEHQTKSEEIKSLKKSHHEALKTASPNYNLLLQQVMQLINTMPPSGAIAGLYTKVDNLRGVWKAPANYSLEAVNSPVVNLMSKEQEELNVDAVTGKSINVLRPFQGLGTMVWGGRTLDGNSQDWRYINVRRTMIMIEQSIKLATRAYVFEPNDANTWITVKSMVNNFLVNLWKLGALAGAAPEEAFDVQIGLGSTMTPNDILEGKMLVTVKVAVLRPAEFIVVTFVQELQQG